MDRIEGEMCTISSKINGTPKGVYLPISKLQSILVIANLLAHNYKSQICYCGQISLQSAAVILKHLELLLILLLLVHTMHQNLDKKARHIFYYSINMASKVSMHSTLRGNV